MRKKIYLPHINYTVYLRPYRKPPPSIPTAGCWWRAIDKFGSEIYLKPKSYAPQIAHELVHVLQHICETRHMTFEYESEHMAYTMQYLLGEILGYKWAAKSKPVS